MINVIAGRGDAAVGVAGKDQLDVAQALVLAENARAALLELPGDAERIPLDAEIEVADGHPGQEVAHGAAGQIDVGRRCGGELLHAHQRRALLGREPAFEQVHIVRHSLIRPSGASRPGDGKTFRSTASRPSLLQKPLWFFPATGTARPGCSWTIAGRARHARGWCAL